MCGAVFEQAAAASGVSAGLDPAQQLQQAQRESAQQQQVRTNTAGLAATGTTSSTLSLSYHPTLVSLYICVGWRICSGCDIWQQRLRHCFMYVDKDF